MSNSTEPEKVRKFRANTTRENGDIVYRVGPECHGIKMSMFQENRHKLAKSFREVYPQHSNGIIFLEGGKTTTKYSADTENFFRQESFFAWAFGVRDPDCYGTINIKDGSCTLYVPQFPGEYVVWFGEIKETWHFVEDYGVDQAKYEKDLSDDLKNANTTIFRLSGQNTDSKITHPVANHESLKDLNLNYNDNLLWPIFVECRVIKSEKELDVMRYATKKSSEAHKELMKKIRPGWMEYQAEAQFRYHCYDKGGMKEVAYNCIGATGENAAILHYGHAGEPNNKKSTDNEMVLFDMGGEYYCYASDITCSYPINGKFNDDQKIVYTAVYNAWKGVLDNSKAGVKWPDMHKLAEMEILKVLKSNNLIKGDLDDMMADRLGAIFMPHGLGHLIGLDVHDIGGYTDKSPKRSTLPGLSSLRTARELESNMCITIEPGCYFIWSVIEKLVKTKSNLAQYLVMSELERFKNFGGVRIESDVIIHDDHAEDMCDVPRSIEEIETFMATQRSLDDKQNEAVEKVTKEFNKEK